MNQQQIDRVWEKYVDPTSSCVDLMSKDEFEKAAAEIQRQADADTLDAARWRALLSSPRIRILGTAGFDPTTDRNDPNYRHFGMEIWSMFSDWQPEKNEFGKRILTKYADAIIAAQPNGGTER